MNKRSDFLNWICCIATTLIVADIIHILKSPVHFNDCMLTQFASLALWIVGLTVIYRCVKECIKHRQENVNNQKEEENIDMR